MSGGFARLYTHFVLPSAALRPNTRPSPETTTTTPSPTMGGDVTSLDTRVCHSALPAPSNASTSPLDVATTTRSLPAPGPADSAMPALCRHATRPVAVSIRMIDPSVDAA